MVLLVLCTGLSCGLCSSSSDEEQIRKLIDQMVDLAEKHDIGGLEDLASEDLVVRPWSMRRGEFKRWLFVAFRRYGDFKLHFPRPGVEIDEQQGTATASIYFLMLSGGKAVPDLQELKDRPDEWLDKAMNLTNLFKLTLGLSKIDGDWLVSAAHFKRLKGLSFH
jgi:hypothetical protein